MELNFENLLVIIREHWQQLKFNSKVPRYKNAIKYTENIKSHFISNINSIQDLRQTGKLSLEDAVNFTLDFTLELCSFLFAAGYATEVWKRWASIYTANLLLAKKYREVLIFSLIAQEMNVFESLPDIPLKSKQLAEQVLWTIAGKTIQYPIPSRTTNSVDKALKGLVKSIPLKDYKGVEKSFKEIADYYIEEGANDEFIFGQYPVFDEIMCAIASVARLNGYKPLALSKNDDLFFEPGLSVSGRTPLINCKNTIDTCYLIEDSV